MKSGHPLEKERKEKFDNLISEYGLDSLKKEVIEKTRLKWNECYSRNKSLDFDLYSDATNNNVVIDAICNTSKRQCKVTGLDISHQKTESWFLSESSVKRIFNEDEVLFKELSRKFGSSSCDTMKTLFERIAHNVRNKYWNRVYMMRMRVKKYETSLFPIKYDSL